MENKEKIILNIDLENQIKNFAQMFLDKSKRIDALKSLSNCLKPLDKKLLKYYLNIFFDTLIINENSYQGSLFIPENYRKEKNYKSINYPIKEFIFWSMLYPDKTNDYIYMNENGDFEYIKNKTSIPHLSSMEYKEIKTKGENGLTTYTYEKPKSDHKLESGWLYDSSKELTQYLAVGFFQEIEVIRKPKEKKTKSKKIKK